MFTLVFNVIWQQNCFSHTIHKHTRHVDLMREILYAQGEERSHKISTSVLPFNGHLKLIGSQKVPKNISEMLYFLIRHRMCAFNRKLKEKTSKINDSINTRSMAHYKLYLNVLLSFCYALFLYLHISYITPAMNGQFFELPI